MDKQRNRTFMLWAALLGVIAIALAGCTSPTAPERADCPPGFELTEVLAYPSGKLVAACQEITFIPAGEGTP